MTRRVYPAFQVFECERVQVLMTHIGGYPRHYDPRAVQKIQSVHPKLFIAGHSHILKVIYDPVYDLLHVNPGAAGEFGFHKVRTAVRLTIDGAEMRDMEVGEWPATENPAGGELKPTVRESLFRHKITRNKILYPKRPKMLPSVSVIVSEISGTFRQVAP